MTTPTLSALDSSPISSESLRQWYVEASLTNAQFASQLGVTARTVQRYLSQGISDGPTCIAVRCVFERLGVLSTIPGVPFSCISKMKARVGRAGDFHNESLNKWWKALASIFSAEHPDDLPETRTWTDISSIEKVLDQIATPKTVNHTFCPTGGGLDFMGISRITEYPNYINLNMQGLSQWVYPSSLSFVGIPGDVDASYFLLQTADMNLFEGSKLLGLQKVWTDMKGNFYTYQEYDEMSQAQIEELTPLRFYDDASRFVFVHKGGGYNAFNSHYTPVHQILSAEDFKLYAIEGFKDCAQSWSAKSALFSKLAKEAQEQKHRRQSRRVDMFIRSTEYPRRKALSVVDDNVRFVIEAKTKYGTEPRLRLTLDKEWRYLDSNDYINSKARNLDSRDQWFECAQNAIDALEQVRIDFKFDVSDWHIRAFPIYRVLPAVESLEKMFDTQNKIDYSDSYALFINHLGVFEFAPLLSLDISNDPSIIVRHESFYVDKHSGPTEHLSKRYYEETVSLWTSFVNVGASRQFYCDLTIPIDRSILEDKMSKAYDGFNPQF